MAQQKLSQQTLAISLLARCHIVVLLGFAIANFNLALAQPPGNVADRVEAHVRAGEFGPALRMARGIQDPATRNRLLGSIALAQTQNGARNAGLQTLAEVSDDRYRTQMLDNVGGMPLNGDPARGGGTQADFDTLIDLITRTIAPTTWDAVGGPGAIDSFPSGVYVDASGLMKRLPTEGGGRSLVRQRKLAIESNGNADYRRESALRKVSLNRLEREVQLRWAARKPPTEIMRMMAGVRKIKYVFIYPETGDVVIAGPAGDWQPNASGQIVGVKSGKPVLQLDDFVVVLRNAFFQDGAFTCSITPVQERLAATKAFLTEAAKQPLKPGQRARERWLEKVRDLMGQQKIEIQGLDPRTRAARVIVEADYRMKLVGMGLEEGVFGVEDYLDSIELDAGQSPPAMSVLRWWFTMNYDAIAATPSHDAYEIKGPGAKVLSENEMLTELGERIHTGKSDELNSKFARSFTKHFEALASKYPIYADMRNIFDLALVASLLGVEDVGGRTGWHMPHFLDEDRYQVAIGPAPTDVETVINHRLINRKHIVAGVSGGVLVNPRKFVLPTAIAEDDYGVLKAERIGGAPKDLPRDAWWWD